MGRGQQAQVQQQGTQLLNSSNASSQQNQEEAQQAYKYLMPAYQSMYSNPGYTAAQKDSIARATEGGTGAAFGAASQEATNRAARTNNAAGLTSTMDDLARTRMQTAAQQTAGNEVSAANAARSDQRAALSGMQGLYSGATGAGLGYEGQSNNALGTLQKNAAQPGFWDQLTMGLINAGGQIGAAYAGKG